MQLKIEKSKFKEYSLDKIHEALQIGLSNNYKAVEISIVDCPNLRDWGCPSEGISGNQKIIDVGGEPYMHDPKFIGAEFDYEEISKMIGSEKSYALGAGSGAMSCLEGHCGELVINENLITSESKSIIARVGSNRECIAEKYTARKHGGLGNVFYTDGVRGKVIKIKIKGRSGEQGSLPQAMRKALSDNLKIEGNDHLALAGVFRILKGKIKSHVQPDYADIKHEYYDPKQMKCVKDFLQFYEPGCAVVVSHDRWFLDRIATHILAFEGNSHVEWFEGNYEAYEADKKRRLGSDAAQPSRIKYKPISRG